MNHKRLLWNDPAVIAASAVTLFVTLAIIVLQISMRDGVLDPESIEIFRRLFLFEDYPAAFLYVLVVLLALVPAAQAAGIRFADQIARHPARYAAVALIALASSARYVYLAQPLSMDEAAAVMQARIFAAGSVAGQLPAELMDWLVFPPFQGHFVRVSHATGEIVSAYWPGFALLLTPFAAMGLPWLCNPVLGAMSLWVIYRLTTELTGRASAAGAAVLFTVASAAFVVNSASYYSMTAHLLCNATFALLLIRPTSRRAFLAGLVGGLALTLHNPLPHALFAIPWLCWLMLRADRTRLVAAVAAGYLPWILIGGFGWYSLMHQVADTPASLQIVDPPAAPIMHVVAELKAVLRLPDLHLFESRIVGLAKLWLWASPVLIVLAAVGTWRNRSDVPIRLLAASAALTFVGYLFVPVDQGHGWGFRYFHSAWFVLPVLAAVGLASRAPASTPSRDIGAVLGRYAQGAALCSLIVMVPFFLWRVHGFISSHLMQLPTAASGDPRVVIISPYVGYYAQDLVQNDPFLRDPVIRMITHGRAEDEAMMKRHFPDLKLLARSYRGSVWGRPDAHGSSAEAGVGVDIGGDQQR